VWTLSGFADEISPDLQEQCRVLDDLGMTCLEFRSAWGTNVSDLDGAQLTRAASTMAEHGIAVTCIGSPIGKIRADGDFDEHRARLGRCLVAAQRLDAPYVRVFSFFTDSPQRDRDVVLHRMGLLAKDAEAAGVVLLHENESGTFGNDPQRCLDLVESVGSPALRLTWDPANFVAEGVRPFDDAYPVLRPYVEHLQIKDKVASTDTVVPAGAGDGQIAETLAALREDGFDGVFSLEPHLGHSASGAPFSGPELFAQAHAAFTGLLRQAGATFR
jgi:sugar phosphate isomerase/epimerase